MLPRRYSGKTKWSHEYMSPLCSITAAWPQYFDIVQMLWPVYGYANEDVVPMEKLTPALVDKRGVGLYAVVDSSAIGIALLKCQCAFVEGYGAQKRLAAVPYKHHLRRGLRLDILLDE